MAIRLIITDLDGTFLSDFFTVSEENKCAVKAAQAKDVLVCVCTTRSWRVAKEVVNQGGFAGITACSNGAAFVRPENEAVLEKHCMPKEGVKEIVEESLRHGAKLALHTFDGSYIEKDTAPAHFLQKREDVPPDFAAMLCDGTEQMLSLAGQRVEMIEVVGKNGEQMPLPWSEKVNRTGQYYIANQNKGTYHITMRCASKLQAAKQLARMYGAKPEEIMCLGDTYSDQEMIQWAGIGVATGNAEEGLKPLADYVTGRCDESGFAQAVAKFVL